MAWTNERRIHRPGLIEAQAHTHYVELTGGKVRGNIQIDGTGEIHFDPDAVLEERVRISALQNDFQFNLPRQNTGTNHFMMRLRNASPNGFMIRRAGSTARSWPSVNIADLTDSGTTTLHTHA
jgi:hypothetical protein